MSDTSNNDTDADSADQVSPTDLTGLVGPSGQLDPTALQILQGMRTLFEQNGWCRRRMFREIDGKQSYCLVGAMMHVQQQLLCENIQTIQAVLSRLLEACKMLYPGRSITWMSPFNNLYAFNDQVVTRKSQIFRVIDRAIECQAKGSE